MASRSKGKSKSSGTARTRKSTASASARPTGSKASRRSTRSGGKSTGRAAAANGGSTSRLTSDEQEALDAAARETLRESDKLYYRIGEVSRITGVKAHVLRYWETEFRWMAPPKSRSKQRLYRKRDIEFVWLLKRLLWTERYTIAGARQRIQDLGTEDALKLLDQPAQAAAASGVGSAEGRSTDAATFAPMLVAIEEMQSELLAVRADLAEGPAL